MKKTKKLRNYNVGYEQYSRKFYELKKAGNLKRGMRKFSKKHYNELRAQGDTNKVILKKQMFLSKKKQKLAWKKYQKLVNRKVKNKKIIKKNLNPGEKAIFDNTYWGGNLDEEEGLGYHRTLSGLMQDKHVFHFLISNDILTGEKYGKSREEVLAQYGY